MASARFTALISVPLAVFVVSGAAGGHPGPTRRAVRATVIELAPNVPVEPTHRDHHESGAVNQEGVAQTVSVVIASGPLTVLQPTRAFALTRVRGTTTYRAIVRGYRVVDTRASEQGWRFSVRPEVDRHQVRGSVHVHVARISAFARSAAGLRAVDRDVAPGRAVTVAEAAPGHGRGAYDVTVIVTWEGPSGGPSHVHGSLVGIAA